MSLRKGLVFTIFALAIIVPKCVFSTYAYDEACVEEYCDDQNQEANLGNTVVCVSDANSITEDDSARQIQKDSSRQGRLNISNALVTSVDATGYTVEANVKSDYGIKEVKLPTWTSKNGQDDLVWHSVPVNGNHIKYHVNIKDHNYEAGTYVSHLYAYDNAGQMAMVVLNNVTIKKTPVSLSSAKITAVDATGYTVEANVKSDYGIKEVKLPTWTSGNGQDDLVWHSVPVNGNHIKYHVNIKDHKYEAGTYISHLYAYDNAGQMAMAVLNNVTIKKTPVSLSSAKITAVDATGYTVEANVKSDYGIKEVKLPTWTSRNGQDDLVWHSVLVNGNHIKYRMNIKDHNYEAGTYISHLYAYDNAGQMAMVVLNNVTIKKTPVSLSSAKITTVDATGYTVEANVKSDYGIKAVKLPTWTNRNGQDDLVWHSVPVNGNHIKYRMNIKDHNYEAGNYISHLYAYDNAGQMAMVALNNVMIKKTPVSLSSAKITAVDATGYTVEANVKSDYGIKAVKLPTWTNRNGQDDLVWHSVPVNGNHIKYRMNIKDHNYEAGNYISHLYAYDNAGQMAMVVLGNASVKKTPVKIISGEITSSDATGYTVEANVKTDYGLKEVKIPVWTSANGQDDLVWHSAPINGNHIWYHVNIKDHKYEDGIYTTHLYVYDNAGQTAMMVLENVQVKKTSLQIKDARIVSTDERGYTVEAVVQTDYGIQKAQLPTWTDYNGQDDLVWHNGTVSDNHVSFRVSISDHFFEQGNYTSHFYVHDNAGREAMVVLPAVDIKTNFQSGFNSVDGKIIFVRDDGSIASGFVDIGTYTYYFDPTTKVMATGNKTINGRNFTFNHFTGKFERMSAPIPYFNQTDSRWGYKYYGQWSFARTGCVPTAAAMVFSFLSGYTTPDAVANWAYHNGLLNGPYTFGSTAAFWGKYSAVRGAKAIGNVSQNQAILALKHGNLVVAAMNPGIFTSEGTHEIVLYGIDSSNTVQVYDPLFSNHNGKYSISTIFSQRSTHRDDTMAGGPIFIIEK